MLHGKSPNRKSAITLLELLIALVLFVLVALGISNIEVFFRNVFTGSERKSRVINEAGYTVEHMSKFMGMAVGDPVDTPVNTTAPAGCTAAVRVWVDDDSTVPLNGIKDAGDRQIMYCFNSTSHSILYYDNYTAALPGANETIARNIMNFTVSAERNTVDVNITACWDAGVPAGDPKACGSVDNPRQMLQTRVVMPSVSINATAP
ncbi:MAG: prepilin-type N-terminal cleavage/methylation domain-containing protein [Candidatus Omnitrophota bacterium]